MCCERESRVREVYGFHMGGQDKARPKKSIRSDRSSAQAVPRAHILLKTDEGWTAPKVAPALDVSLWTVRCARQRHAEEGLEEVLRHYTKRPPK